MGDPDPYNLAPDGVRVPDDSHYVPPEKRKAEPLPYDKEYYEAVENARRATKEYEDLLTTVVDEEGKFLARMYIVAKYYNRLEEYKELIETGMKLRPDRVKAAGDVFTSLGNIYDLLGNHCEEALRRTYPQHWNSLAADEFEGFFTKLIKHIHGVDGQSGLAEVCKTTGKLVNDFGDAMKEWRHNLATAIKVIADYDRERQQEYLRSLTGMANADPMAVAGKVLELLLKSLHDVDKAGRERDLKAYELHYDAGKLQDSLPNVPEVAERQLILHGAFEPKLA
mgnify:CR=1 FL=1